MKVKSYKHAKSIVLFLALLGALLLFSCALLLPTPSDEDIVSAVILSNEAEVKPLNFVYDDMMVPHRLPGRASAVLWVADKSIQRNFTILYHRQEKSFYVEAYTTLLLGADGVYRVGQP